MRKNVKLSNQQDINPQLFHEDPCHGYGKRGSVDLGERAYDKVMGEIR